MKLETMQLLSPQIGAKMLAEFLGSIMFHFIGSMSPTPLANGLSLMTSVYYSAKISGGHLNPAVSTVFCIMGFITPIDTFFYILSQVCGCITGALLIAMVVPTSSMGGVPPPESNLGCFRPDPLLSESNVVGWEAIGTIMFIVPVMSVVWYTQNKKGYGNTGPIMVGISLASVAMAVGNWTGASLNPARTLGSAVVFDCARTTITGAYIAGQMIGAFVAPVLIVPWYGISKDAWYINYISLKTRDILRSYTPSIVLRHFDHAADNV
jgi:aquaporin TIP